jgi:hypothetical protein
VVALGICEVTVIARVLCATAQSEQAAGTMAELWGEQVGLLPPQDAVMVRALADLGQGARGRIVELRLAPGRRPLPRSPLRPGATVYVAEGVLIEELERSESPSTDDAYALLVSRLDRNSWRVRVVDRASGVVAASEWFEDEAAARRRHQELKADAETLGAAAFRARYRLP